MFDKMVFDPSLGKKLDTRVSDGTHMITSDNKAIYRKQQMAPRSTSYWYPCMQYKRMSQMQFVVSKKRDTNWVSRHVSKISMALAWWCHLQSFDSLLLRPFADRPIVVLMVTVEYSKMAPICPSVCWTTFTIWQNNLQLATRSLGSCLCNTYFFTIFTTCCRILLQGQIESLQ